MPISQDELKKLKEYLITDYASEDIRDGDIVTISCPTNVAWEDEKMGTSHNGCGEQLARFIYAGDGDMWDIAADLYLAHLHNTHGYRVTIDPIDIAD